MPDKSSEPVFLIDLDGTLADFDGAMEHELARLRSPGESLPTPDKPWSEADSWIKARRDLIKRRPGFWRNLPVIPDGRLVFNVALSLGFRPMVLTQGPSEISQAWAEKLDWCREHVPDTPITVTRDKGLVYGKVLFDDWPDYAIRWLEWRPRGLVIMLEHPWNKDFSHPNVMHYRRGLTGDAFHDQKKELIARLTEAKDR